MRLATILKILGILVVAVVVGVVVVLMNIDFNQYKGLIAQKVKEATGRNLMIDGDIKLALSLSPTLAVNGVKFQNATWGSKPDMATVERFEAQVALLPLLSKQIEVNYVVLKGANILIERDKQGRVNYAFETRGMPAQPSPATAPAAEGGAMALQLPVVHKVLVENAALTYADAMTGKMLVLALNTVSLSGKGPDTPVDLSLNGTYNKVEYKVEGQLGATSALTDPAKPWPVKLTIEVGGATIKIDGSIRDVAGIDGLQLAVSVDGKSLAGFSELAGAPVPPLGPYSVKTNVRGGLAKSISLEDIAAKIGKSDLGGKLSVQFGGKKPVVNGAFKSTLIDLADFTAKAPPGGDTAGGGDKTTGATKPAAKAADGRIFQNDPLPVDGLRAAEADVALDAKRILVNGAAVENLKLALALHGGQLKVDPFKAEVSKGTIDGRVQLNGATATPALDATVKAVKVDLGKLLTDMDITNLLEGALNADIAVKGQGASVRALMAGLNGNVTLAMGEGRMKTTALDTFIGGPTQIVTKMISGDKKEYTAINCVVSQTDIKNGLATLKTAAVDTEYARITGKGTVNLATEGLDISVVPEPKSATLNLAVGVKIGGTLANPSYGLDNLSALRKLGGAALGIGFPPALLLGLGETGASGDSPCLKSGGTSAKPAQQQAPATSSNPVEKATEGVGNMFKGLFGK